MPASAFRRYRFEDYVLDTRTRELRGAGGEAVTLTAKAFDTLDFLVANRDRVVGKDELMAAVWAGRVVEENNLTQAIAALRRAFGTDGSDHRYIVTIPGRGYRFVADAGDIGADEAATPAPAAPTIPAPPVAASPRDADIASQRRVAGLGALLFSLALFAIAAWHLRDTAPPRAPVPVVTLAVMPFRSITAAPRDELLELGLADTLVTRLSRSPALRVRSLASSQRLAARETDALAAGRELGAAYVVEGSAQRIGEQMRVNARLLSVAQGRALWSGTFDAGADRVFTLQDDIADAVASALEVQPPVAPEREASPCDGDDSQAYRGLIGAQYKLQRRAIDTIAAFQDVIRRDPVCARGYAGLATAYMFMAHYDRSPDEVFPLAAAASAQALRIDPDSAAAHVARGRYLQLHEWKWREAEAELRRAIEINPSLAEAHFSLAHLLVDTGRFNEGLAQARQARELDPLSPLINALEAGFLSAAGMPEEAQVRVEHALELEPDFWIALLIRGGLALDRGDTASALADLQRAAERSHRNSQVLAVLAIAHVAAGDRARAEAILGELDARARTEYIPATSLAAVHTALGQTGAALDQLERAQQAHDIRMAFLGVDARWNSLRREPRFRAIAAHMGLSADTAYGRF
ncbi:winged helix-turn-helix domain-containing protein [Lysobacter fragariae]